MLKLGSFELYSIVTGTLRLDGGAMFGVVPKVLWANRTEPDELNRIPLVTRTLLAVDRARRCVVLVDTGCGTKWDPQQADRFAIQHKANAISEGLGAIGLSAQDVTDVVITHLHFDHNGGLTAWEDKRGGPTRLCYPNARHWIHKKHWEHAHSPHRKDSTSFLMEDFQGLAEAGVLRFVEGEDPYPSIDGVEWLISQGHTPYQLLPVFASGSERLVFVGDMVPTIAHLRPTWVMAYDVRPTTTIDEKVRLFHRAIEHGWSLDFPHEPEAGAVEIGGNIERPIVRGAIPL